MIAVFALNWWFSQGKIVYILYIVYMNIYILYKSIDFQREMRLDFTYFRHRNGTAPILDT